VCNERRDPELATLRRFEAVLGFDPQEAPQGLLDRVLSLSTRAGEQAAEEIAPACAGPDPAGGAERHREYRIASGYQGYSRPGAYPSQGIATVAGRPVRALGARPVTCAGCSAELLMEWSAAQR
jgi:hypothetical protein